MKSNIIGGYPIVLLLVLTSLCFGEYVYYTGYLADNYCLNLPGTIAVDGINMTSDVGSHSVHCLRDITMCLEGYSLMTNIGTNSTPHYVRKYTLDEKSNQIVISILKITTATNEYLLTVEGNIDNSSPPVISIVSMTDSAGFSLTAEQYDNDIRLTIGLSVGLGVPLLALIVFGIYKYRQSQMKVEQDPNY